ncbi:hypothetical protein RR46_08054 [Papilio xuthus]|uniref:Uncharacterized protein n=1 Tax=Papilio xuthus TaxID=66420 RepID=A0A194Q9R6_PAPXU|nr:hypothetical protein RR46_08054 [Papilio xuthus]
MIFRYLILALGLTAASAGGLQALFPQLNRQYCFTLKTNSSSGILAPREGNSFWTLEGRLLVTVYDNYTKARFKLEDLKTNGLISAIYVGSEPVWATNMKRALAINFQMKKESGTYGNYEVQNGWIAMKLDKGIEHSLEEHMDY